MSTTTIRYRSSSRSAGRRALVTGLAVVAGVLVFTPLAQAQLPLARLTAVHPSGAQRGTSVDITVTGTDLDESSHLYFSHPGITAAPKTQMVEGKAVPVAGQFVVTVSAEVPPGVYDMRARGLFGLSNPRSFTVGDRKEVLETEPNNTPEQATAIELNSVVNGRSDGGADIDWYKISAKAGQRILASLRSRKIDSRMEGVVELYQGGRRLAHQRVTGKREPLLDFTSAADGEYLLKVHDFVFNGSPEYFYRLTVHTGPHLEFILPASGVANSTGEYTVYGRNLAGGQPSGFKGSDGKILEQLKVQIATASDPAAFLPGEPVGPEEAGGDGIAYAMSSAAGTSNPLTIFYATAQTGLEQEPNDAPDKAQKISVPIEVTGQFQARGDVDVFHFDAKPGDVYWIEVFGQRNGDPADPVLTIDQVKKNEKGEEVVTRVTVQDDNPLNIGGPQFNTTTDDPVFRFAAPAEATFRVTVRDRSFESRGDPSLVYRLSIRKEQPDFRLVALPAFPSTDPNQLQNTWDLGLRKGDNVHVTVMAFRRDGYIGPIEVNAEGLSAGVTCSGATIGTNQNAVNLVLTATEQAPEWFGSIRLVGRARMDDPVALAAQTAAEAARTAAVMALPALEKAIVDQTAAQKGPADQAKAAKETLDKDPNNEGLKKAKADADAALAKADAAVKAAVDAKAAGDKKLVEAIAAVATTRTAREQAAREVAREARAGTIVWSGNPAAQVTAQSRLARTITLSVLKETAAYQLLTDVNKIVVNQGSQILIPFRMAKRAGFDNPVTLTFVAPPPNVQVENKPIAKGAADGVYRVYVQNNAAVGTYTLFVQSQSQVSYSRNPEAAALAAKEKEVADKLATDTAATAKAAADAKVVSDKKAVDTAAAAKAAADAKVVADKLAVDTAAAAKAAADEKVKADKLATDTATVAKTAADDKVKADKLAVDTAAAAKTAADEKVVADKLAADTVAAAKAAADAKVVADKLVVDTTAEAKAAADAKVVADKLTVDTAAAAKAAADAKVVADKLAVDTAAAAKTAADAASKAKEALDKDPNNETLKKSKADADAASVKAADDAKKAADAKVISDKKAVDTTAAAKAAADAKVIADKKAVDTTAAAKAAADAKVVSDKKAVDTAAAAKAAADAKAVADKKAVDTAAAATAAADAKVVSDKAAVDTDALAKKAAEEKVVADKLAADTDQKSKAATAAKAISDKKATDTANAAKPQNLNSFFPATPIVVQVRTSPGTLALTVPNSGALKRGATLEVKAVINRANGFTGPVTLSMPLPPGVAGLSAAAVTIPADKSEGTLVIQAAGDATMGQLPNMVIRASMDFDGPSAIDQPVAINVQQ
ncbi:MAG: hypothetical protein ACKV0T_27650 [Planctomycetales bacterium]